MPETILPRIPRIKTLANSTRFVRNPLPVVNENIRIYGSTFAFYMGGVFPAILMTDPDIIRHVLQKNHRHYKKSPLPFEKLGHFLGT